MSLNGAGFPCQREIRRLSQLILKKSLSGIRRLGFEGEQPLYRRFPTPDAHQAVQKIAPKSSGICGSSSQRPPESVAVLPIVERRRRRHYLGNPIQLLRNWLPQYPNQSTHTR